MLSIVASLVRVARVRARLSRGFFARLHARTTLSLSVVRFQGTLSARDVTDPHAPRVRLLQES